MDYGIQEHQGSSTKAAGNRFSNAEYQFYNGSNNPIRYYQYEGDNDQVLSRYYNVIPYSAPENECQPHYNNGGNVPVLPNVDRQQRENDYYNAYLNTMITFCKLFFRLLIIHIHKKFVSLFV